MDHDLMAPDGVLRALAAAREPTLLAVLSLDEAKVRAVQDRLAAHSLLDPPADGFVGPAMHWALREFARLVGEDFDASISPALAARLLDDTPVLPLRPGDDLAGRVVRAMQRRGDWVCRHPAARTIAYLEGTAADGSARPEQVDAFCDLRLLLAVDGDGRPVVLGAWDATTRSGSAGLEEPADEDGPPRLEPGQYRAWAVGRTAIGTKLEQEALVQSVPLPVRRDAGKDGERHGDPRQHGLFVIDQHGAFDADAVGDTAVGCLVVQSQDGHAAFMAALRADPRWIANNAFLFTTSLLTRADLA